MGKIPVVYVGQIPLRLSADHGPYVDGQGNPLTSRDVKPGDTLMMDEEEATGVTYWHDPLGILPSEKLGAGRVVKAEHQGLDMAMLQNLGYDFHDGRPDFEPYVPGDQVKKATPPAATAAPLPTPPLSTFLQGLPLATPVSPQVPVSESQKSEVKE